MSCQNPRLETHSQLFLTSLSTCPSTTRTPICTWLVCRAVMYNFPLHSITAKASTSRPGPASPKPALSSGPDSPAAKGTPAPTQTQLCLLVDVTASKLKRVGRYTLGRVVGRGAFGVVRLGQNTQTGRPAHTLLPVAALPVQVLCNLRYRAAHVLCDMTAKFSRTVILLARGAPGVLLSLSKDLCCVWSRDSLCRGCNTQLIWPSSP